MELYVVMGEYDFSRNGDVAWIVGVAENEDAARRLAEQDAQGYGEDEVISIGGERYDPERKSYDPPARPATIEDLQTAVDALEADEEEEDEDPDPEDWYGEDWTITYSWTRCVEVAK